MDDLSFLDKYAQPTKPVTDYDGFIEESASRHNVDPDLIRAVTTQESSWKPKARSNKGASGLMQLMPATARNLGVKNIYDPKENIEGGTKYLRQLLDMFGGDVNLALAGYNAGEGAVQKYGNKIPPYKETQNYVKKITSNYKGNGYRPQLDFLDKYVDAPVDAPVEAPVAEVENGLSFLDKYVGDPPPATDTPTDVTSPVPESPDTLQAQILSTFDANSPKSMTLLTNGNPANNFILSMSEARRLTRVDTPNGIVLVNAKKLNIKPSEAKEYVKKNGFAKDSGFVIDMGNNTGDGQPAVAAVDPNTGKEVFAAVTPTPESAQLQAQQNAAMFPGTVQVPTNTDEVAAMRDIGNMAEDERVNVASGIVPAQQKLAGQKRVAQKPVAQADTSSVSVSLDPNDFTVDGEKVVDIAAQQPNTSGVQMREIDSRNAKAVGGAYAEIFDIPDSIKTPEQASEYVNARLRAKYPDGTFTGANFPQGWEPGDKKIGITYDTLQGAGVNIAPDIAQKVAENNITGEARVSKRDFGYTTEAEAEKNLEQRIKEPDYAAQELASEGLGDLLKSPQTAAKKIGWAIGNYWNSDDVPAPSDTWVKSEKDRLLKQYNPTGDPQKNSYSKAWAAEQYYQNADGLEKAIRFANQTSRSFVKNLVGGTVKSVLFIDNLLEPLGINAVLPEKAKISIRNAANVADLFVRAMQGDTDTKNWQNSDTELDKTTLFKAIKEFDKAVGDDPVLKGRLLGSGGDAFGSAMSFVAMAALMPSLKTINFWGKVRNWDTAIAGALQSAGSGYEEGKNSKLSETQAKVYGVIQGLLGTTEALGAGAELAHLLKNDGMKTIRAKLAEGILEVARHGYREGKQEFGQEVFQTTSGKVALEYLKDNDPSLIQKLTNVLDRLPKQFRDTVTNEGLIGLVTGGTLGAGTKAATITSDLESDGQVATKNKGTANIPVANADLQSNKGTQETSAVEPKSEPETDLLSNKKTEKPKVTLEPVEDIAKSNSVSPTLETEVRSDSPASETQSPYGTMAADYLLNGGTGGMLSSDYLLQGFSGAFRQAGAEIDAIRRKYLQEIADSGVGDIANFTQSELYSKVTAEIRQAIANKYGGKSAEAHQILDEILKYPSGVPVKLGQQLSNRLDALHAEASNTEQVGEKSEPTSPVRERAKAKAAEKFGVKGEAVETKPQPQPLSNTQIEFSPEQAKPFDDFRKNIIDPKDVADKSVLPEYAKDGIFEIEPHVTVKYGLHTNNHEDVIPQLQGEKPIAAELGKTSVFKGSEKKIPGTDKPVPYDVVTVEVKSPDLERLNKKLTDGSKNTTTFPYSPHVTLAYVKSGEGEKYAGKTDFEGQKYTFDGVTFSPADKSGKQVISLAQPKAEAVKEPQSINKVSVGDTVYFPDAVKNDGSQKSGNFRGWDGNDGIIVIDGSQWRIPKSDITTKKLTSKPNTNVENVSVQKEPWTISLDEFNDNYREANPHPDFVEAGDYYLQDAQNRHKGSGKSVVFRNLAALENPDSKVSEYGKTYADTVKKAQQWHKNNPTPDHKALVAQALRDGKPVPASVLADYPDLQARANRTAKLATRKAEKATNLEAAKAKVAKRVADRKEAVEARHAKPSAAVDKAQAFIDKHGITPEQLEATYRNHPMVKHNAAQSFRDAYAQAGGKLNLENELNGGYKNEHELKKDFLENYDGKKLPKRIDYRGELDLKPTKAAPVSKVSGVKSLDPIITKEVSRFTLTNVIGENGKLVATDGHRLLIIKDPTQTERKWYDPKTGEETKAVGNFPNYEMVIPKDPPTSKPMDIQPLLDFAHNAVAVGKNIDNYKGEIKIVLNIQGEDHYVDSKYLYDGLRALQGNGGQTVTIATNGGGNNAIQFTDDKGNAYIVMPLRGMSDDGVTAKFPTNVELQYTKPIAVYEKELKKAELALQKVQKTQEALHRTDRYKMDLDIIRAERAVNEAKAALAYRQKGKGDTALRSIASRSDALFDGVESQSERALRSIPETDPLQGIITDRGIDYERATTIAREVLSGKQEIRRLSPEGERGRIAGGERNVIATLILAGNERASEEAGSRTHPVKRQERVLEEYAKREGIWLDPKEFNTERNGFISKGVEAYVHRSDDGNTVTKLMDYKMIDRHATPLDFIDNRISAFNYLFPETKYELVGFTRDSKGDFRFVVKQRLIRDAVYSTPVERQNLMRDKGLEMTDKYGEAFANNLYKVSDLHEKNALKGKDGNIYVIDAVPKAKQVQPFTVVRPDEALRSVAENERNLLVVHNLSSANVRFADKLGGLAMPSIAITNKDAKFGGFGDISLIGEKELIDPKNKVPVTDADMYSPRYPSAQIHVDDKLFKPLWEKVKQNWLDNYGERENYSLEYYVPINALKDDGLRGITRDDPFIAYALKELGVPLPESHRDLYKLARDHDEEIEEIAQNFVDEADGQMKYFKGWTNAGNKRLGNYDLETVVKQIKSEMKDGEGWNYGAGNVRSKAAKRFRSIKEIQADRNRIVSEQEMDAKKEEMNQKILELADQYKSNYKYDSERMGYYDQFTGALADGLQNRNLKRELEEYGFEGITDFSPITEYLDELRNQPTEYFEAKPQRAVGLDEFKIAAVPDDITPKTRAILEKNGLDIVEYKRGDAADRQRAVAEAVNRNREVLFKVAEPADIADIEALGKGDFKELFNDIKSDVKSDANGANILDLGTNKTIELVRTAFAYMYDTPLEGTAIPGGMYLDPSQTNDFRDALQGIADAASENGVESKGVDTLIKNLDKAAKDGDVRVIGFDNTLPHETIHQQSRRGAIDKELSKRYSDDGLGDDPVFNKFHKKLIEIQGKASLAVAREEALAYLSSGDYARFGLTEAEATEIVAKLIESYAAKNGLQSLKTFDGTQAYEAVENYYRKIESRETSNDSRSGVSGERETRPGATQAERAENDTGERGETKQSKEIGNDRRPGKSGLPFDEKEAREADAKGRKVAAISRIIGVEIYYDPQSNTETAVKAEQLTGRVGVQKAIADALTGKPSAEGMKVVYTEFARLNALYDHFNDNGQEAEAIAIATELADLANAIQERQLATGQEAQIARTFDILSPDIALLMAQRRIINKRGEGAKLTPEETAATIDAAKQLSKIEAQLEETRRKLRNSEAARRRLESDKEPRKRAATSQEKLLKEYQEQKTDLFAQLEKLFPDSPLFNGKTQALRMIADTADKGYWAIKGKDVIGRDIPDWANARVYHSTDETSAQDIANNGYRYRDDLEDGEAQEGYYGTAISFTPDLGYTKQFGGITTIARVSSDARILNLNDEADWDTYIGIVGRNAGASAGSLVREAGYDGLYDAGAGDLFIVNPEAVTYQGKVERDDGSVALRSIAEKPLDPLKQEVLTKWATGQILEGLPYEALIKTLEQFGISQVEAQQIHSDAVDVIKPAREPRTAEAKEKTQIRNEHYREAKKFASDGKPQLSGIAQDAQEDAKYKDDPKLIEVIDYLTNVNTAKAGRSLNSLINGIREANPEMSISDAERLAGRAQQAVNDLRLKRKRAADKAKNISEDARQEINRLTVEKRRASRRMSDHLKQLGRGTEWAMHRFNNLMRAAFVNNYVTQLFNAVQSTAVATPTQMALDGITQLMLRGGLNIGENTEIQLKDLLLPEAYIFANNKQLAEQALAHFPEEYFRIHAGILGDIEIDKVAQADTAHWLTKPLHKVLDKADKATDVLSKLSLSKVQEMYFRNAIIASRFDQLIRAKSGGDETLESALKNGEFTKLVTEKDATRIADDALEVTFAAEITDPIGKKLKAGYDVLDNFVPIFLNPVTYARFTYTTTKVMVANPLLFGAMDAKIAGGRGYNTKSVAKGVLAWSGVAVAYALTSALGGDDDRWDTLYVNGKDNPPLSIKRFFPLSAYFYVAHLIRQYKEGGTPPTKEDLLEGFMSLETEYYTYGPGLGLASSLKRLADGTGSGDEVGRAGARMMGNFFGGLLSVLKPAKLALSAIDDEEATLRDDSDTAKEKFISEISRAVPGIIRLSDAPKKIDPVTDKPILQPWILGRAVGLNFVHPSFLSNKDSAATQWANRLFAYEGGSSQMSAEDRNAYFIKKRLKEAMRRGEIDLTTANAKAQQYLAKVLAPESMKRLQKELELSELQSKVKAGFSQPDDPKKAAKELRDLRVVWDKATDQEKEDIRKVLSTKRNLSSELIEEFGVTTTKQAKMNKLPDNLESTFDKLGIKPPGVGDTLTPTKGGDKVKLTPEQQEKYERETIERIDKKVESLQSKPAYQNADDALRKKMVEGIIRKQRAEEAAETKKEMSKQKFASDYWGKESIIPYRPSLYEPQFKRTRPFGRQSENVIDQRGGSALDNFNRAMMEDDIAAVAPAIDAFKKSRPTTAERAEAKKVIRDQINETRYVLKNRSGDRKANIETLRTLIRYRQQLN